MLDQLFDLVKKFGQDTVVTNPDVPNEHNESVMADATKTIAGGFQNVLAGGGFQNILDLFKGGGSSSKSSGGGIGNLIKNPMVTMMIGHFISKLVGKYKMAPAAASGVANNLIPNTLTDLINKTNDPANPNTTLDGIIGSLTGGRQQDEELAATAGNSSPLQDLLDKFTGGGDGNAGSGGGFDLQDIIGKLTNKAQNNMQDGTQGGGGGLMDIIKGFMK